MHLSDTIESQFRLTSLQKTALKGLGLVTLQDLLYHLPSRYEHFANLSTITSLAEGDDAVVYGVLRNLKTRKAWKSRRPIAEGTLTDGTGSIKVMWFNQPYIAKMIPPESYVKLSGTVGGSSGKLYLANPEVERSADLPIDTHDSLFVKNDDEDEAPALYAIYPERRGITSRWLRHAVEKVIKSGALDALADPLPEALCTRYHLPALRTALIWIHAPKRERDAASARKRFAFEEIFTIQLARLMDRNAYAKESAIAIKTARRDVEAFIRRFSFPLTGAQKRAIDTVLADLEKPHPMSRLLEGDVGSGKTAVAATTAYATIMTQPPGKDYGNLQVAYMAPTEILAQQHFESFIEYFSHLPVQIGLITGSGCKKFPSKVNPSQATPISRTQLLKWVANGEIPILIGTHALIQKSVTFKNLAYVIIDEQHRFGTNQRRLLSRKDELVPHLLSMSATPIPRTLALTMYGDLDISLLDEMPPGRKPIDTKIVLPHERERAYAYMRQEIEGGRQAYVICPRIDEPDPEKEMALQAKSVIAEAARLSREVFPEAAIQVLHGKMTPKEKEKTMDAFARGAIDILVATSVVEVGVNVPNATTIMIEGAQRYGLAQLHQLRGRVRRSTHQAACFVCPDTKSKTAAARLRALVQSSDGFALAEQDLLLRGPGELYGKSQSGLSDLGMEALKNPKLVEAARSEAQALLHKDPDLSTLLPLAERINRTRQRLHFE